MPHKLTRQQDDANGTITGTPSEIFFEFAPIEWIQREAGDDDTNLQPSFIGKSIRDVIFHKARLGFLTEDRVVMSEVNVFFNLWRTTVLAVIDSDRIDVASSNREVALFTYGVDQDEDLILFSDRGQYRLKGEPLLTPKLAAIEKITSFEALDVEPLAVGERIYFGIPLDQFSGLRELYRLGDSDQFAADLSSSAVPEYIEGDIEQIAGSDTEDVVFVKAADQSGTLYGYKFFWQGQRQLQAAWFKYTFDSEADIKHMDFIQSDLYLLIERDDGLHLEKMTVTNGAVDTGSTYKTTLDMRVDETDLSPSYAAGPDKTTWTFPYDFPTGSTIELVKKTGEPITVTANTSTTVQSDGDDTGENVWGGVQYTMTYTFSKPRIRTSGEQRSTAAFPFSWQILHAKLRHDATTYFETSVSFPYRTERNTTFGSKTAATPTFSSDIHDFPLQGEANQATITVTNDSHLPSNLLAAQWDGKFVRKSVPFRG